MKMKVSVNNKDKTMKSIDRAEALIKELRQIFSWDLSGEIILEMKELPDVADNSTEVNEQ